MFNAGCIATHRAGWSGASCLAEVQRQLQLSLCTHARKLYEEKITGTGGRTKTIHFQMLLEVAVQGERVLS